MGGRGGAEREGAEREERGREGKRRGGEVGTWGRTMVGVCRSGRCEGQ